MLHQWCGLKHKGYMLYYVHSSPIYNCQMLEGTRVSLNRRVDAKNVVYLHNGVLFSH